MSWLQPGEAERTVGAMSTRVAIYARLSSDPLGNQTATQRQADACERYAELREWTVEAIYEDVDVSAYKPGVVRPGYEEMVRAIDAGRLDGVLVWKLDRLVRRPAEFERYWQVCERNSTFLTSVTEPIDSSTELGLALVRILVTFASLESATTSLRMRARNEQAARAGQRPARGRVYGLNPTWTALVPNEAAVIREAADRVVGGETIRSVAESLNARSVPSPGNTRWSPSGLSSLLSMPRIAGDRSYRGQIVARDCFPAAVPRATFEALQARRTIPPATRSSRYLLTGLILCGRCGNRMYRITSKALPASYACHRDGGCARVAVTAHNAEALVERRLLARARWAKSVGAVVAAETLTPNAGEARAALARARAQYRRRDISAPLYFAQRRALERDLAVHTMDLPSLDELASTWPEMGREHRRGVLQREIERITTHPAKRRGAPFDSTRIDIAWRTARTRAVRRPTMTAALRIALARRGRHAQRWLSVAETAALLGDISPTSVCGLVIDGVLPAFQEHKVLWFREHEVQDYLAASRLLPAARRARGS
jgi:site-specific DNA recombinase